MTNCHHTNHRRGAAVALRSLSVGAGERHPLGYDPASAGQVDYRELVDRSPAPCFETDAAGSCVYVNGAWCELSGLTVEESLGLGWLAAVDPDDAHALRPRRSAAIARGEPYSQRFRVRRADGSVRHLHTCTDPITDSFGEVTGWLGWVQDETPRHELIAAVAERDAMIAAVFDQSATGMVVVDLHHEIVRANPRFCRWIGLSESELVGLPAYSFVAPEEHAESRSRFRAVVAGHTLGPAQRTLVASDGTRHPVWTTVAPIRDADGKPYLGVVTLTEFAERHRHERHLLHLAHHDPLTGLPNRRALDRWIADTPARGAVVIDLDGFKALNDRHGHAVGDAALVQVADRLRSCVAQSDLLCRLGGDEFLVLLRETGRGDVAGLVQRIAVEFGRPFLVDGHVVALGATMGVAEGDGTTLDLAVMADDDLYRNKAQRGSIPW